MSGGVPRRRKRRTRRRGAWGDGPVPPPLFSSPSVCSIVRGIPQLVSLIGVFLMWCPGRPFTTTTGKRAGRLAGNPAPLHLGSSAPTRWGAPHGGVPQVVPRCGAGGAPRWWGPTLLGAPHPASPDLALRTTWSSRSHRPLLTVSLVLTVSLRRTTRLHGLPHQRWGITRRRPSTTRGGPRAPHRHYARRVCSGLAFGFTNSSSH